VKEEFLHYLWRNQLLNPSNLHTTDGQEIQVLSPGQSNTDSGPDFVAAKVRIGDTLWAGQVEIHIRSSHWEMHGHQRDAAYGNVILHVVYEHDREVFDQNGNPIPVLEVNGRFRKELLSTYLRLMESGNWVPCKGLIRAAEREVLPFWLNRLAVERLERKSDEVLHYLQYFQNDWDQTLYFLLARNFGFKINATPFGLLAQRTPLKVLLRISDKLFSIESILFGQAGHLSNDLTDDYPRSLLAEYRHQKTKYNLEPLDAHLWKFSKLRPQNFPTIRISQFAGLLSQANHLFGMITDILHPDEVVSRFRVKASEYWDTHYTFEKESPKISKALGIDAIHNILINTLTPVMFVYGKQNMRPEICDRALEWLFRIPAESNSVISNWASAGISARNAAESQALLELKKYYCTPKNCLRCAIGTAILKQ